MSSLKKAFDKVAHRGSRSGTPTGSSQNSDTESATNGHGNGYSSSPRASGTFDRPHRASGTWNSGRTSSPRSSGIFSRNSVNKGHHSPVRALKDKFRIGSESDATDNDTDTPYNRDGEKMSKNQLRKAERQAEKEQHKREVEERAQAVKERRAAMDEKAAKEESPETRALYGEFPVNNYAGEWKHEARLDLRDLSAKDIGKEVTFRARVHNVRKMSSKLVFFVLRQQTVTVQGVLHEHGPVSSYFVYWAEHIDIESVVLVRGIVQAPAAKQGEIIGASIHDCEIAIHALHVEAKLTEPLPFTVNEAEVTKEEADQPGDHRQHVSDRVRQANRILDLRTTASQSIFRIQAGVCQLFRESLNSEGFIEIHTPKMQGGASESGASVFKIDYFGRPAFLAQSPQLGKQMAIAADFKKVYEIGPVFRAENSNTHRHLTEFTGLDLEMAIDEHYHEILRTLDRTFKHIFSGIYSKYRAEIDIIKRQFPHEDLVWLDETPIIPFADAIKLLNSTGWRDENGNPLAEDEDMGTRDEIQLGKVIKEKYKTDYYVLDKFPVGARPFYAMPDPNNPKVTNAFDIFVRGQEILSGGQRIHDASMLLANLEKAKIDRSTMEEYVQGFEWGAPPHGGGGIGLERIVMLLLNLGDIRNSSMFPRDPKSLPARPPVIPLRHPEASTLHPPWEGKDRTVANMEFQTIEKLIANYGDATNTSWLEPRTQIWRDEATGAAVGYVPQDGFAITVGDPLCHESQYAKIIAGYIRYIKKETNLKLLWLLVGSKVETVLADKFNWRTFSVVSEQRLDPQNNPAMHDPDVQRKVRHAEKEGVKIFDFPLGKEIPQDLRDKIDKRVGDWLNNRKGKQVHLTNIRPWQDMEHRQYYYAVDKDGEIAALVVLAQLSPEHGWQVKYSLDFPGAPSGTIEYIVTHALKKVASEGCRNVTFGGGASPHFTPGHNLKGAKVKMLSKAYHAIVTELKLTQKTEFREKLGAKDDPIYVCYPPHGLGPMGVKAILNFFEDD
ncbi:aspartate-tRNA(Asn) ligase [Verruconis gallopava]|uniref:Aspartate--tRNA ligase, cytoplasmic n=1 Tax=Verruconis gallopava TaxID=253628 RepID=A0A0D2AMN5_9PEZI|nr:aspartate-tRNA(Asn) ligase [Verruconis gallopava]KIW07755.1 aspartate-tRNA(Asn) ligase [Verruconis gallopava]